REIGDADGTALCVSEFGDDDRRIAQVLGLDVLDPIQNHIGEALFLVAGEQAAEHRIAFETWKAPPGGARRRLKQGCGAAVADERKIKAVIGPRRVHASTSLSSRSQRRTSCGPSKLKLAPGTIPLTEKPVPPKSGRTAKAALSVMSSPTKIGLRPVKGGTLIISRKPVPLS